MQASYHGVSTAVWERALWPTSGRRFISVHWCYPAMEPQGHQISWGSSVMQLGRGVSRDAQLNAGMAGDLCPAGTATGGWRTQLTTPKRAPSTLSLVLGRWNLPPEIHPGVTSNAPQTLLPALTCGMHRVLGVTVTFSGHPQHPELAGRQGTGPTGSRFPKSNLRPVDGGLHLQWPQWGWRMPATKTLNVQLNPILVMACISATQILLQNHFLFKGWMLLPPNPY